MPIYGRIYGLHDPRTDERRYIGQTRYALQQRLRGHLTERNLKQRRRSSTWLRALAKVGLRPLIRELAVAHSQEELDRLEVQAIAEDRVRGVRLLNHTEGGRGQKGRKHSEAWKRQHAVFMRVYRAQHPFPKDMLQRVWDEKRGVPLSAETKAKIATTRRGNSSSNWAGGTHKPEVKAKIAASRRGKHAGAEHHGFRHDIKTDDILKQLMQGLTKVAVAKALGVSPTFIHRRIAQIRRSR